MKFTKVIAAFVFLCGTASAGFAQTSATHDVTVVVPEFNMIAVSGNLTLTLGAPASPGGDPTPAVDAGSSYFVTTNATSKKVTVALDSAFPTGITLTAELTPVGSSTSAGAVTLSATAQDAVTGLGLVSGNAAIEYTASATAAAGTMSETRTVTYTLTD